MIQTLIEKLTRALPDEDIEFRVGATSYPKGFQILAYKTQRADVRRLNEVFGLNWGNRFFYDDNKNLCCAIYFYDEHGNKIERVNVGTESNTEKEKGSYSDAFKRASFTCGIGIELYDFPFTWISTSESDWISKNGKHAPKARVQSWTIKGNEILDEKGKKVASINRQISTPRVMPKDVAISPTEMVDTPPESKPVEKVADKPQETKAETPKSDKPKTKIWLTHNEFNGLINLPVSAENIKKIESVLAEYNTDEKSMKKVYRKELENMKDLMSEAQVNNTEKMASDNNSFDPQPDDLPF